MLSGPALFWKLSNDTGVTSLVGTRIDPIQTPTQKNAHPRIVYDGSEQEYIITNDGPMNTASEKVVISCIGRTALDARNVAKAVSTSLGTPGRSKGTVVVGNPTDTWGGMVVQGCFIQDSKEHFLSKDDTGELSDLVLVEVYILIVIQPN